METTNIKIEVGKIYNVDSERKGKFVMLIDDIDADFVHGTIIEGKARAAMLYNERKVCDEVSVRKSLTKFYVP